MYKFIFYLLVLFTISANVECDKKIRKKMVMKKVTTDLDSSASGYYYTQSDGSPAQIIYLNQEAVQSPPWTPLPYSLPYTSNDGDGAHSYVISHIDDPIINGHQHGFQPLAQYVAESHPVKYSSRFNEDGGAAYEGEHYKKKGESSKKSHDNEEKYEKGDKGDYAKEDHEGHYEEDGSHSEGHHDEGDYYGQHHQGEKATKGGKFGEKKHHKKGSKTTGYHNVFHKDEYKKDHTFYDDSDHKGNFHKYGDEKKWHNSDEGKGVKGGHHAHGFQEAHKGKNGDYSKGHYDNEDQGYDKKHGYDHHFYHDEDYGKKGGHHGANAHGYKYVGH